MVATLGGMGVLLDGYDLSVIGFGVLLASASLHFSAKTHPLLYSLVLTSALIGMVIGGTVFGWLADKLGRKTMFTVDLLFFVVFALLSAFSQNVVQLIVFRVLMGVGIGADYPISSTLISEFAPAKSRGRLLMYGIMFYWVGALVSGVVNYLTLGLGYTVAWRAALAIGGLIAVPVVVARNVVPESPRWLVLKGNRAKADKILNSATGKGLELPSSYEEVGWRRFLSAYWKPFIFVLVSWFGFDVGAYGLGFYTSTLYREYGFTSLPGIALFGAFTAPFPILAYLLLMRYVDRVGRKLPAAVGLASMAVILLVLPPLIKVNALYLLPLFIVFVSLEQWPGGVLSFAYSVELFPTSYRARAQGVATAFSRVGAIMGTLLFLPIASHGLIYGTAFFDAFVLVSLVAMVVMAPATERVTLEEASHEPYTSNEATV